VKCVSRKKIIDSLGAFTPVAVGAAKSGAQKKVVVVDPVKMLEVNGGFVS